MDLVFGTAFLCFGLMTLVLRFAAPNSALFNKLEPMKERFGEKGGLAMHVLSYTVLPLVAGASILYRAL